MEQPTGLLSVLLDTTARDDERDDAAMDLAAFEGRQVENALASVACDESVRSMIRATCGASLAEIWIRRGLVDEAVFGVLRGEARAEAQALLARAGMVQDAR